MGFPPRGLPRSRGIDDQLVRDPEPRELVDSQSSALKQRSGLSDDHVLKAASIGQLGDDAQRRAAAGRGQRAGVAMGHDLPDSRE
jgi:hypothetical protein